MGEGAREAVPFIALLLMVGLLSSVGVYQTKVSRLHKELTAQTLASETARLEHYQQTVSIRGRGRICQIKHGMGSGATFIL